MALSYGVINSDEKAYKNLIAVNDNEIFKGWQGSNCRRLPKESVYNIFKNKMLKSNDKPFGYDLIDIPSL